MIEIHYVRKEHINMGRSIFHMNALKFDFAKSFFFLHKTEISIFKRSKNSLIWWLLIIRINEENKKKEREGEKKTRSVSSRWIHETCEISNFRILIACRIYEHKYVMIEYVFHRYQMCKRMLNGNWTVPVGFYLGIKKKCTLWKVLCLFNFPFE